MASKQDLTGAKMPSNVAALLGHDNSTTYTAAGTTQGTATPLTGNISNVTTVAASSGVVLQSGQGQAINVVMNNGANALKVYPAGNETINGGSAGAAFSVATGKCAFFIPVNQSWFAVVSA